MQLIATARYQAALSRATAGKPYTEKLAELVADLSDVATNISHPLLATPEQTRRSSLVVITSNRGLCGGYNSHVLRSATTHLDEQSAEDVESDVHMVGLKGVGFFKFLKRAMSEQTTDMGDAPKFDEVEPIANALMSRFTKGETDSVFIAYMRFMSMGKQRPFVMQLLPLARDRVEESDEGSPRSTAEYEFSPEPEELLNVLLPATVRAGLYQCFLDAAVSEQIARMVAMKAATDAAGDMISSLTQKYNRARQTHITMELLDIVGGANALA